MTLCLMQSQQLPAEKRLVQDPRCVTGAPAYSPQCYLIPYEDGCTPRREYVEMLNVSELAFDWESRKRVS
jgi:hypothetical protein